MAVAILCVVALFFVVWVILLKLQIEELKEMRPGVKSKKGGGVGGAVAGMRKFEIGGSE